MSVSTLESENAQPVAQTQNSELIYRLEDRPPLPQTLFAACQHLLAMFVAVITPALLICQALGLPAQDTQHIISMSLFASGVASIIQIKAWGPVGSGLLSIQGTSFNFVAPLIMGGTALKTGGADVPTMMAALFGTLMLASCTEMVISRVLHLARRIITPLVSGVVVMIIGLSLIQVGLTSIGGGYAAMSDNTFGAPKNLLLAGVVLALIILLNRQRNPYLRVASLVIAMAAGYALAWFMGIIDGVRLCKAKRYRYANNDMQELEARLKEAREAGARHVLIATDGVFSMDGVIANLKGVCDLADKYDALVMVDDSHAVGFVGENGRGSHEYCDVMGRVDIITGTLGKALGGASGGYTAARKEVVEWLRQRSRPYLFSNSLAPAIVAASIKVLEMVEAGSELRDRLWANARQFREQMSAAGFTLAGADHAIIPVMLGDAVVAQKFARELQKEGIYVTGFFYPVVPKGQARIRTQMSAAHTPEQITRAVEAFTRIGKQLGVIA